ncbi:MAG: HAD family phosphatase [Actinomycetota bacterium]
MSWVLFDYGGVISRWPSSEELAALSAVAGAPEEKFSDAYWRRRSAYDRAEVDGPQYWQQVGLILGRSENYSDDDVAQLCRLDADSWLHLDPGAVELIEELSASGHRLALLSDAPSEIADAIAELPVARHFEHLIFSCQVKLAKPDPACYETALAVLEAEPDEVIFLDDRTDNLAAAAAMGIGIIQFTSPEQARTDLTELLFRNRK